MTGDRVRLVNEDGTIVGTDPETGDRVPIEFEETAHESITADGVSVTNEVSARSIRTLQLGNATFASEFDGDSGGERIRNAVSAADLQPGPNVVVVDGAGPDDVSDSTGALSDPVLAENAWELHAAIELPSYTTLLLEGCYLFLSDGTLDNLLRNADFEDGNEHVTVAADGAILDGNAENQGVEPGTYDNFAEQLGIRMFNVDHVALYGYTVRNTAAWSHKIENVTHLTVHDVNLRQTAGWGNMDGVKVVGPAERFSVYNIYGRALDDLVSPSATASDPPGELDGEGGDIRSGTFANCVASADGYALLRLMAGDGYTLENITAVNLVGHDVDDLVRVGWDGVETVPSADELTDITISNVRAYDVSDKLVDFETDCSNIHFHNLQSVGGNPDAGIGITENITAENLRITNMYFRTDDNASGSGVWIDTGTVTGLHIDGLYVAGADRAINMNDAVEVTGVIDDVVERDMGGGMLIDQPVRLGMNCPPPAASPDHVRGSVVHASPDWDPDGDGNGEIVVSDGEAWQEVVDLPNWM